MGLKAFAKGLTSIITLGDSNRLEKLAEKAKNMHEKQYNPLMNELKYQQNRELKLINEIYNLKVKTISIFKKLDIVCGNIKNIPNSSIDSKSADFRENLKIIKKIDKTVTVATPIVSGVIGGTVGVGTAAGVWALTSTFGLASTGTPIALLHGIAASNAILATLGGGSLAVGGLGMAGGTALLGGIIAAPVFIFSIYSTNKKVTKQIAEAKENIKEMIQQIPKIQKGIDELNIYNKNLEYIAQNLNEKVNNFEINYKQLYKKIYPWAFFSRIFKEKKVKQGKYYTKYTNHINKILNISKDILENFF